ncbi:ribonuclease [Parcubacteria bacterium DG_74_2]|nr:MAG: ribonuclease [Parcubacteria bacterium DG_74_2]
MEQYILLAVGTFTILLGAVLGYYARQSVAKKKIGTIEEVLQKKISKAKEEARKILNKAEKELGGKREELLKTERILLRKGSLLDKKTFDLEKRENEFRENLNKFKAIRDETLKLREEALKKLEEISGLSKEKAKEKLFDEVEKGYKKDLLGRIKKLEGEGLERFEKKAKEILSTAIQKCAIGQAQEITTTNLPLPSEEIKGRIIGKEGRNIRTLEKLTGVEVMIDDTPETVMISSFDPVRRQIAKIALEKLILDGRIQPARIEEKVKEAQDELNSQIKEAGETAVYDVGIVGLDPKLIQLLGRLKFRTSYSQNILLHSLEVAHLAGALAAELEANISICKKAGLLHDIGKSIDSYVEGSHIDIGIKILEKFKIDEEVIEAMKCHHEEYPCQSLEGIIVKVADQISGARPGARKDTVENYLKRLSELEEIAASFPGVEKVYAVQAGKEIRVFVKPEKVDDFKAKRLARDIAQKIEEELRYPGEIKVNVIRELRVIEYAR